MQPRMLAFAMIFAGLATAGTGIALVRNTSGPATGPEAGGSDSGAPGTTVAATTAPATPVASAQESASADPTGSMPRPLAGTRVDGALRTDAAGKLVIDRDLRRVFDYFLAASAAEPYERSAARLQAYLAEHLAEPAAGQAAEILEQYLQYKARLFELETRALQTPGAVSGNPEHLAAHIEALARIRREVLSPEVVTAFFAVEEAYDRYILERYRILADPRLTEAQKAEQMDVLRAALPGELRALLARTHDSQALAERTRTLRTGGADDAEIRRLRLAAVGPESTERLEALDRRRTAWETRLALYRAEKAQLTASRGLAGTDLETALEALLARHFNPREQLRVQALERMSGQ